MKIENIFMENFRGLKMLNIDFHPNLNIFVGKNGDGKTSILDFIAIMMSQLRIVSSDPRFFKIDDINNHERNISGKIRCKHEDSYILAECSYSNNKLSSSYYENISGDYGDENGYHPIYNLYNDIKNGENELANNFPLVVYYPTNRAILDIPERIRGFSPTLTQLNALNGALENSLDFRLFVARFRESEKAYNEYSITELYDNKYTIWFKKQFEAVQRAIRIVVPELNDLHVEYSPFRIAVNKNGEKLNILQLSDGEKCLIALIGDLAQRLAMANPILENPLEGEGIVLIDEIELHLHPAWQRMIIKTLAKAFPNCQFFFTTHSPQIIGEIEDVNSIFIMNKENAPYHPDRAFGLNSNEVLGEIMDTDEMNKYVQEELDDIYDLIENENFKSAKAKIESLSKKTKDIPAIIGLKAILTTAGE